MQYIVSVPFCNPSCLSCSSTFQDAGQAAGREGGLARTAGTDCCSNKELAQPWMVSERAVYAGKVWRTLLP